MNITRSNLYYFMKNSEVIENEIALIDRNNEYTYGQLEAKRSKWIHELEEKSLYEGMVVGIQSEFSFNAISLLLALFSKGIIVALIPTDAKNLHEYITDGQIQALVKFSIDGSYSVTQYNTNVVHPLLLSLHEKQHSGFIIFSSGTTGKPKAILHDTENFLEKFLKAKKKFRTLAFLLFDHIAGLDTLFYSLYSGGSLVLTRQRQVADICKLIEKHKVEVFPTSPTFLNLLCLSHDYVRYNLSSLKIITYGSEPMNKKTLEVLVSIFPDTRIIQKYGTSEFGSPPSKTRSCSDLWIKIDSDDFKTRVIDGILWVKTHATMLGYLNAPELMSENGWICTNDQVEVNGEWIKILGRKSDIINVGGEKVFPSEIESVILQMLEVEDVLVKGEPHPMMGRIIIAIVKPVGEYTSAELRKKIRKHCRNLLPPYKIPVKYEFTSESLTTSRQKKIRS